MIRRKQGGFMASPTGGELLGCLSIVIIVLVGFGILIGLGFPWVWMHLAKPFLLWLASLGD